MSTEGWIFMVGFRVFDVGLLIAWLIWFFRLREDGPDIPDDGEGGGGGGDAPRPRPRKGPGGGGLRLPTGRWPAGWRRRDGHKPRRTRHERPGRPLPQPLPARVRFPGDAPERIKTRR
jgi:hypothetical protein